MLKNKLCLALLLILCLFLGGCKKDEQAVTYTELTQSEVGEPGSDWGKSATGSAKYLDGTSVLVTIYLDDVNSLWLESDEQLVSDNMKFACDYLAEQGKLYGKEVKLIYDTSVDSDLAYRLSYKDAFAGSTRGDKAEQLVYSVYDYIENNIDTQAILEKYNVNSIGYMVFIDGEADRCTAYCYQLEYRDYYYNEFCLINLRWNGGRNVYPDTYAHEILHIFGARDLYYTDKYDGLSRPFIDYVYENYDTDIMLGSGTNVVAYENKITSDITDITAYYLGWLNYLYEFEEYPYIKSKYPASFSEVEKVIGVDFMDYTVEARKLRGGYYTDEGRFIMTDEKISALIALIIAIIMLACILSKSYRMKKIYNMNSKQYKNYKNSLKRQKAKEKAGRQYAKQDNIISLYSSNPDIIDDKEE